MADIVSAKHFDWAILAENPVFDSQNPAETQIFSLGRWLR